MSHTLRSGDLNAMLNLADHPLSARFPLGTKSPQCHQIQYLHFKNLHADCHTNPVANNKHELSICSILFKTIFH